VILAAERHRFLHTYTRYMYTRTAGSCQWRAPGPTSLPERYSSKSAGPRPDRGLGLGARTSFLLREDTMPPSCIPPSCIRHDDHLSGLVRKCGDVFPPARFRQKPATVARACRARAAGHDAAIANACTKPSRMLAPLGNLHSCQRLPCRRHDNSPR
jgi:hypothetical protein